MKNLIFTFSLIFMSLQMMMACNMICNDYVNVSLAPTSNDPIPHVILTPDMFLEGDYSTCNPDFVIQLADLNGNIILDFQVAPRVECVYLGEYQVTVRDNNSMSLCWGVVNFTDPEGHCGPPADCILTCNDNLNVSLAPADANHPDPYFIITADAMLEGNISGCTDVSLRMEDLDGNVILPNAVTLTGGCDLIGTHVVVVTDNLTGNTCWGMVAIEDKLDVCGPSNSCNPVCISNVVVSLTSSNGAPGSAKVYIESLFAGDTNGCNLEVKLEDFDGNTLVDWHPEFLLINCDHIGVYIFTIRNTDTGNTCWGPLTVEDKNDSCGNLLNRAVANEFCDEFDLILNESVKLTNGDNACQFNIHEPQVVDGTNKLSIESRDVFSGITTLDLVILWRALIDPFDDPRDAIAADFDGSGALGTGDLLSMRLFMLGIGGNSFKLHKMIPQGYQFPADFDQFDFENNYSDFEFDKQEVIDNNLLFEIIKVGELSNFWSDSDKPKAQKQLYFTDMSLVAGQEYTAEFRLENIEVIEAITMGLVIDNAEINMVNDDYDGAVLDNINGDELKLSIAAGALDKSFTFSVNFTAFANGQLKDVIHMLDGFHNDLVDEALNVHDIQLVENPGTSTIDLIDATSDVAVYPNPSNAMMTVAFDGELAHLSKQVSFFNQAGQLLYIINTSADALTIDKSQTGVGVVFMTIQTDQSINHHKLLFVD